MARDASTVTPSAVIDPPALLYRSVAAASRLGADHQRGGRTYPVQELQRISAQLARGGGGSAPVRPTHQQPAPLSDLVTRDFLRSELEKYPTKDEVAAHFAAFDDRTDAKFDQLAAQRDADRTDAAAQLAAFRAEVKNQFRWLVGIDVMILGVIVAFGVFS